MEKKYLNVPGHYKKFADVYDESIPTEEHVPSKMNNIGKVSAEQQVIYNTSIINTL